MINSDSSEPVYMDWYGHAYTRDDFDRLCEVWVCTEHSRFLPCRACPTTPAGGSEWHSCDDADVQSVREFQSGDE